MTTYGKMEVELHTF